MEIFSDIRAHVGHGGKCNLSTYEGKYCLSVYLFYVVSKRAVPSSFLFKKLKTLS